MKRMLILVGVIMLALAPSPDVMAMPLELLEGMATRAAEASGANVSQYVVLYADGASLGAGRAAVRRAGGTIVKENAKVGLATVRTTSSTFLSAVAKQAALAGAARDHSIGQSIDSASRARQSLESQRAVERLQAERATAKSSGQRAAAIAAAEPLAALQWDMAMINATAAGSQAVQPGDRRVLVGVIDTGIDGSHPDIAPNFNKALSRNFTTDIPLIDGACADDPDGSCEDPNDVDEDGHGTHVAGTIAAAANGLGIAGVAPNVTLVNLRAGQDSGFFFLQPTVDALTYAAENGIHVVNMSFFVDPWLFNCASNPADSAAEQTEQRTIIKAIDRALSIAVANRVTLVGSAGNEHTNLNNPTFDATSPDFPPGTEKERTVDNSCLVLPTEGRGVLSIGAVGPSRFKADYSNYGTEQVEVVAPGGYFRDFAGTPQNRVVENLILSAYPQSLAEANGELNPDGTPNTPFVVRDCQNGVCAYYQYLQGTSMASPHAAGVAALIVSEYGVQHVRGITLNPITVKEVLIGSAQETPCPAPILDYTIPGRDRPAEFNAPCVGDANFNNIYGHGIIDALAAVTYKKKWAV